MIPAELLKLLAKHMRTSSWIDFQRAQITRWLRLSETLRIELASSKRGRLDHCCQAFDEWMARLGEPVTKKDRGTWPVIFVNLQGKRVDPDEEIYRGVKRSFFGWPNTRP